MYVVKQEHKRIRIVAEPKKPEMQANLTLLVSLGESCNMKNMLPTPVIFGRLLWFVH